MHTRLELFRSAGLGCVGSMALLKLIHFNSNISTGQFITWTLSGLLSGMVIGKLFQNLTEKGTVTGRRLVGFYFMGIGIHWILLLVSFVFQAGKSSQGPALVPEDSFALLFIMILYGSCLLGCFLYPIYKAAELLKVTPQPTSRVILSLILKTCLFWYISIWCIARITVLPLSSWHQWIASTQYINPYLRQCYTDIPYLRKMRELGPIHSLVPRSANLPILIGEKYGFAPYWFTGVHASSILHKRYYVETTLPAYPNIFGAGLSHYLSPESIMAGEIDFIVPNGQEYSFRDVPDTRYWEGKDGFYLLIFKDTLQPLSEEEFNRFLDTKGDLRMLGFEPAVDARLDPARDENREKDQRTTETAADSK